MVLASLTMVSVAARIPVIASISLIILFTVQPSLGKLLVPRLSCLYYNLLPDRELVHFGVPMVPRSQAWRVITRNELVKFSGLLGHEITAEYIDRWHKKGLLPTSTGYPPDVTFSSRPGQIIAY